MLQLWKIMQKYFSLVSAGPYCTRWEGAFSSSAVSLIIYRLQWRKSRGSFVAFVDLARIQVKARILVKYRCKVYMGSVLTLVGPPNRLLSLWLYCGWRINCYYYQHRYHAKATQNDEHSLG